MCDFCSGTDCYSSRYHKIFIKTEPSSSPALFVTDNDGGRCPPFTICTAKHMNINSVFKIKYCPFCGSELEKASP